ncbi:hypothetical protein FXO38_33836 [Capsicum annuum]|nr:hypothetical protein FXO38_33836 [Capsicum annuum]
MENAYVCTNKNCNHEDSTVVYRYRIQVTVMDDTGSISLMIWYTDAMSLIGKSANDLKEELLQNTGNDDGPSYPIELNNILQRKFIFKVIVKDKNIQNHEVYSVVKILDDEDLIKKYSPNESNTSNDHDFTNSKELYDEKDYKESTNDSEMLTSLRTYAKRNRSFKKHKSIIVDKNVHGQLSSNKIHKGAKKKKKSSSATSK